ncbi:MAG: amino acid permease [Gammaproteobacteria bacterium]|nr:amino acid permease [Gammaproteobacteria bacterium]
MPNSQPEHQPESQAGLVRRIGIVSATALVVSNMIGTGIFTTTGFLAGDLGSPAMVILIWVVGGAIALAGALCYVELALNFPRSGGEYVYLSEAWGPSWGFINGWISFFAGFSAPIAAAALAMSAYLGLSDGGRLVPLGLLTLHLGDAQLVACAVVAMFTLLNVLGVRDVGRLQTALTVLKLLIIGGLLVLGFSVGQGDPGHLSLATERTSDLSLFEQFAISLVFVFFAYSGWNAATYVAGEIQRPERTLPVALFIGTAGVTTLYVALNALYVYAVPLEDLKGVIAVGAAVASALFGAEAGRLFSLALAISLLATINAMCFVGPRVYYAMATDGAFFSIAARIHPKWNSPWVAVVMQGICALLLIVLPTFRDLVVYIGFTLYLFTALSVLGLFKLRRRPGWKKFSWLSRSYPLIPLLYVAMSGWVLVFSIKAAPVASGMSLATVIAGALAWHLKKMRQR